MNWRVPLADIQFGLEEENAVTEVLRGGWLSMGSLTGQFEREFAAFVGARHAIAVTNATAALHLACLALRVGPGDEVILPSLTFVATANAIRYTGATPVFADIESLDRLTISPAAIEASLTERTRAILVMHYAGFACDMPAILEIAERHHLAVIEDSAHAIGSELDGRKLGTWGDIGCYSFFSNKNMTTGEGGMLVTDDDALADRLRLLRSHGMTSLSWDRHQGHASSYDVVELGFNYRIDEMRSALGRVQLRKLPSNNERRRQLTDLYKEYLADLVPELLVPFQESNGRGCEVSCYHILPVLLPTGVDRFEFMEGMKAQGVQTSIHYPPVHEFQIYRQMVEKDSGLTPLVLTEEVARREVTLPLYPTMQEDQVDWVVRAIRKVLKELK
jgi:dTDP-4-amino-4,6-dideoxygalactose transaminase